MMKNLLRSTAAGAALSLFLLFTAAALHAATLEVHSFGAKGDGHTLDTAAIQRALDAAHGGTVTFRPGVYLTGSLFVRTGTHLLVPKDVTLRGIQKLEAYPLMPTRVAGIEMSWPAALLNVYGEHDVEISGEGTIDGDGSFWWKSYWDLRHEYDSKGLRWAADYDAKRPRLIQFFNAHKVKLNGPTLLRSGFWTVHICYSDDVVVSGITIRNNIGGRGPSTDGIDIDSSRKVLVEHADIDVNDDALCLKAGRDADGLRVNRPTEDVIIRDSIIRSGAAAVTFGSETSGGFHHIEAYNLTAGKGVSSGVLIKSARVRGGGGSDLNVHDLHLDGVLTPIAVNLNWNPNYSYAKLPADATDVPAYWKVLAEPVSPDKGIPHFSDVHIWNIDAVNAKTAMVVAGFAEAPLKDFKLDHIRIAAQDPGHIDHTTGLTLSDVHLAIASGKKLTSSDNGGLQGLDRVVYAPMENAAPQQPEAQH